jgi:hypothetical protein
MCFASESEGQAEFESLAGMAARIRPFTGWCATAALSERIGFEIDPALAVELAITCWVEDTTALEGVWWADQLAPEILSAPRGVILPGRLRGWSIERVD